MKTITGIMGLALIFLLSTSTSRASVRLSIVYVAETGDIKGTVMDETNKSVGFANIVVLGLQTGTTSAEDGSFMIHGVSPGTYDVQASFIGYNNQVINGVIISPNHMTYLNFKLTFKVQGAVTITTKSEYKPPIVDPTYSTVTSIPAEVFTKMERGNLNTAITNVCSSCSETNDHQLVMRGARPGTVEYVVDGERQWGTTQVPSQMIEMVTVLSGGIPAEYGDVSGGIIIISTKNYISGMRESQNMRAKVFESKGIEETIVTTPAVKAKKEKKQRKSRRKKTETDTTGTKPC